jgi:signal transduction histidine kinase
MPETKPTKECTRLQRLRWGMMLSPLLLLVPYEAYKLLVIGIRWHEVLLDVLVVMAGSFALTQLAFSIAFRLHDRNIRRQERLEILHRVDAELSASLDQEQVLEAVLEGALRLTSVQATHIFGYDPERQTFVAGWECLAPGECHPIDDRPRPDGFYAHVVQTGEPLVIEDAVTHASLFSATDLERGLKAAVGVPLSHGGRVLGVLGVGFDAPHTPAEDELETLRLLGGKAAVALENARLLRDAVQEREVAHTLLDTAETLSTTLRLDELLERVLDELQRVVPYDAASIRLVRNAYCWPVATRGLEHIPQKRFLLEEFPLVQRIVRERGPVIISEACDGSDGLPIWEHPARSWLGVPLISKEDVVGVLLADSHHAGTYDEATARLALAFAHQVALAIDNSSLYEQTREQLREATLLHNVMAALSSTLDVDQILPYVARSLCEILNGTGVEVYRLDEETQTITVVVDYAASETAELGRPSTVGRTYALADLPAVAEALAQRCPLQVQADDPETGPDEQARLKAHGAQSALLLPMVARDRVLGFAQVWDSRNVRRFTEGEITVGQTLTHPAAIAIENARLFAEVEAARVELQLRAQALEEANVQLQEFDRLKSQFLASTTHELRTPLSSIIGFSEILIEGLMGELPDEYNSCVQSILANAQHLLILINDILDLSQIEAGRVLLEPTTFDVAKLLKEVQTTIRPMVERKSQTLTVEKADSLPLLTADRFRVKQVLLNLLSNASKFTPEEGHITLSCCTADASASAPAAMIFSVADTGMGVRLEDQEIIFEEFRQADDALVKKVRGTGLGLAISKRLVEMHGGRIWVESEYDHGATFSFSLPLHGPVAQDLETEATEER